MSLAQSWVSRWERERDEQRDKVANLEINLLELLDRELALTEQQIAGIKPLISQACGEIRQIYVTSGDDIEQIVRAYHDRIALLLTPKQDKRFKELEAMRREQREPIEALVEQ